MLLVIARLNFTTFPIFRLELSKKDCNAIDILRHFLLFLLFAFLRSTLRLGKIKDIYIFEAIIISLSFHLLLLFLRKETIIPISFYTNIVKFYNKQVLMINQRYNIKIRFF